MSNHIPPPYTISGVGKALCLTAKGDEQEIVLAIVSPILGDAERPTLEFIQAACNNYDAVVAKLKHCCDALEAAHPGPLPIAWAESMQLLARIGAIPPAKKYKTHEED